MSKIDFKNALKTDNCFMIGPVKLLDFIEQLDGSSNERKKL